jgi:hypothetical protein
MATTTIGVFSNKENAENAVNELREMGVPETHLSYVYKNDDEEVETHHVDEDHDTDKEIGKQAGIGAGEGLAAGGVIGGLAGLAVINGVLPGLGTLFVAGPLATALGLTGGAATIASGAMTGAAAGGLVGALGGLGVGAKEAKDYEERVKGGDVLVAVDSDMPGVMNVLTKHDAEDVRVYDVTDEV